MTSNHRAASPRGFAAQSSSPSSSTTTKRMTKNLRGGVGFSIRGTFSSSRNVAPMGRALVLLLLFTIVGLVFIARAWVVRHRRRRREKKKSSPSAASLAMDVSRAGKAFADAIPRLDVGEGESDAKDAVLFAAAVEKYAEAVCDAPGTKSAFIAAATERRRFVSSERREKVVEVERSSRKSKKSNGGGAAMRVMPVGLTSEEPEVSSVATTTTTATTTTSMCEEDRALLREELEVRKQEVESRKTSNLISFVSLMQKQTSNALMAEGNKIASDGVAESKAERAERTNRLCVERFHGMTCDALASGLSVACVSTIYFGWHEVTARFSGLTTRCDGVDGSARKSIVASLVKTPFHSVSYAACVVNEGTRAILGFLLILAIAVLLSRVRVTRQFRTTPMFVLFLILGFGVGSVGSRAVFALGGDQTHWLLAWRLYLTLIACVTASTPVIARTVGDRVDFKWVYHVCVGLLLPLVVGRSAFPSRVGGFWSALAFSPGARAQNYYYYV